MGTRQAELVFIEFAKWGFDRRNWAGATRKNYVYKIRKCDSYLRTKTPRSVFSATERDLRSWVFTLPPMASSRNQAVQALKGFYTFLREQEWRDDNPAAGLNYVSPPRPLPKALHPEQVKAAVQTSKVFGPMVSTLVHLYAYTALRQSEVRCLRWSDWNGEWLRPYVSKQRKERDVYLHETARVALEGWRQKCDSDTWMFPSPRGGGRKPVSDTWVNERIREVGAMAGIVGLHPHVFRHSLATKLVDDGVDIRVVQEVLGHESLRSTQVYATVRPGLLKETLAGLRFD